MSYHNISKIDESSSEGGSIYIDNANVTNVVQKNTQIMVNKARIINQPKIEAKIAGLKVKPKVSGKITSVLQKVYGRNLQRDIFNSQTYHD